MITNLKLIRHGKTQASVEHMYCGSTDLPLCDEGINEIKEFIESGLYNEKADKFFSSGMNRANETLCLIYGDVDYKIIPALREMCFGKFEMKMHDDLVNDPEYIKWIEDTTGDFVCPGGESSNSFYERVRLGFYDLFEIIEKNNIENAVIVAHGGTIGYFARYFLDKEMAFYDAMPSQAKGYNTVFEIENGQVNVIKWEKF